MCDQLIKLRTQKKDIGLENYLLKDRRSLIVELLIALHNVMKKSYRDLDYSKQVLRTHNLAHLVSDAT